MTAADKIAQAKGLMPGRIWLLPCAGDEGETLWCDDPAPGAGMREEDAVGYVRANLADAQAQEIARLRALLREGADLLQVEADALKASIGINGEWESNTDPLDQHTVEAIRELEDWIGKVAAMQPCAALGDAQ